jgi:hypothetical protein
MRAEFNHNFVLPGAIIFNNYTGGEIKYTLRMPNIESGRGFYGDSWNTQKVTDSPAILDPLGGNFGFDVYGARGGS